MRILAVAAGSGAALWAFGPGPAAAAVAAALVAGLAIGRSGGRPRASPNAARAPPAPQPDRVGGAGRGRRRRLLRGGDRRVPAPFGRPPGADALRRRPPLRGAVPRPGPARRLLPPRRRRDVGRGGRRPPPPQRPL